jgi:hypothetical protein
MRIRNKPAHKPIRKYTYTQHYEKCDSILNNLCEGELHNVDMHAWMGESGIEILALINLLYNDGLVVWKNKEIYQISASAKGYKFHADGGYKALFEYEKYKDELLESQLKSTTDLNNVTKNYYYGYLALVFLTLVAVVFQGIVSCNQLQLSKSQTEPLKIKQYIPEMHK